MQRNHLKYFLCIHVSIPLIKSNSLLIFFVALVFSSACRKEKFRVDPNSALEISTDTLFFDTVFTKANPGVPKSVNKQIIVRNPYKESIKTSIRLDGGAQSHFRLNVDGEPGFEFKDVEILPKDSIFLFVEVHPDPNNNHPDFNPLIIRDSLLISTNQSQQEVQLVGWGQDAVYHFRDSMEQDQVWDDTTRPVVIYGFFYVKPNTKLTIGKGMKLHFAPQSWLYVEGQIDVRGEKNREVVLQGDRLEPDWEERHGQWGGILITDPSHSNRIQHAIIKNGIVGVYCDTSSGDPNQPNVEISQCMIRNMTYDGISGKYSHIVLENSVIRNCGRANVYGVFGGEYHIRHNTFYMDGRTFSHGGPSFFLANVDRDPLTNAVLSTHELRFNVLNNIIWGTYETEAFLDLEASMLSEAVMDYNLIKSNRPEFFGSGLSNIGDQSPLFLDEQRYNLDLDTLSPAKDYGLDLGVSIDYCDRSRRLKTRPRCIRKSVLGLYFSSRQVLYYLQLIKDFDGLTCLTHLLSDCI